jgi:SAM-dependent methyltransferase
MVENDPLFVFRDAGATDRLDKALSLYVQYFFPLEVTAYYSSPAWRSARTVLDVGTGNGDYVARLADCFPDKRYHGIDREASLVERAIRRHAGDRLTFSRADFFEAGGRYDFLILRFFSQHMADMTRVLDKCADLTTGSVLLVDPWSDQFLCVPEVPPLANLARDFRNARRAAGANYDVMSSLRTVADGHPAWACGRVSELRVPTTIPGHLDVLRNMVEATLDYLEHTRAVVFDFQSVREAWADWCHTPGAYAHHALCLLELQRN